MFKQHTRDLSELRDNPVVRWRLILGKEAEKSGINLAFRFQRSSTLDDALNKYMKKEIPQTQITDHEIKLIDDILNYVYIGKQDRRIVSRKSSRSASKGDSQLTIPEFLKYVKVLFPRETKQVLEADLIRNRGIEEIIEHPELLDRVEPSLEMVRILLAFKDQLPQESKKAARKIIQKVTSRLKEELKAETVTAITGALRRDKHSPQKVFKNLDLRKTISKNLKNYSPEKETLLVERMYFFSRDRRRKIWQIIIAVDQSGSMLDSIIYSTILASIFYEIPSIKTNLFVFDTQIVDLSDIGLDDPANVLFNVNLGGGTDITEALVYAKQLITRPQKTIIVLITDFFEGNREEYLIATARDILDTGAKLIGLAALGSDAMPEYDERLALELAKQGMNIIACTPEHLVELLVKIIS